MIISFSVENWMSFRERASFSMVASRERQHRERVPVLNKYKTRILPIAAIFGGNASGKTNLFQALSFMREFIVFGTPIDGVIPVDPFRLDPDLRKKPTRFSIVLLANETIYELAFAVTRRAVIEEKLVQIMSSSERVLYHRIQGKSEPDFHPSLKSDEQFLRFAFRGTRDNQLFLTNSVSQKVEAFRPIYDWFANCLTLVAPDSRFGPFHQFLDEEHELRSTINHLLTQLDTGITRLDRVEVPLENLNIPGQIIEDIQSELREGDAAALTSHLTNDRIVLTIQEDELSAHLLVALHPATNGSEVSFEIREESDGTQRLIDLLPAFLQVAESDSKKVYVIDEIDRSLHTLLTYRLLEAYLSQCSENSRAQLLFTTHDVLLMDQQLLRRDEMWVTERDSTGGSHLISFAEYKDIRKDKDIRKSYLQGRMGGIPRLVLPEGFFAASDQRASSGDDDVSN